MRETAVPMSYCSIRIERDRGGFEVTATDPEIAKANKGEGEWKDPNASYRFETAQEVLQFIERIIDKALPVDEFTAAFDKAAKEVLDD